MRELNLSNYNLEQLRSLFTRYQERRAKLVPGRQQQLIDDCDAMIESIRVQYRARKAMLTADAYEVAEEATSEQVYEVPSFQFEGWNQSYV